MKPLNILLAVLISVTAPVDTATGQDASKTDLFPLDVGRYWIYRQSRTDSFLRGSSEWTSVRMVVGKKVIPLKNPSGNGNDVFKEACAITSFPDGELRYAVVAGSMVYLYAAYKGSSGPAYALQERYPKTSELAAEKHGKALTGTTITIPLGSFEGFKWDMSGDVERVALLIPGVGVASTWTGKHPQACEALYQEGPLQLASTGKLDFDQENAGPALCSELRQTDPARCYLAALRFIAHGEKGLTSLREMLLGRIDDEKLLALLKSLEHDDSKVREEAMAQLRSVAVMATAQIKRSLQQPCAPEVEQRLRTLLREAEDSHNPPPGGRQMLGRRAWISVVKLIGGPGAEKLLEDVAEQSPLRQDRMEALICLGGMKEALTTTTEWKAKVKANREITPELREYLEARAKWRAATTTEDLVKSVAMADLVGVGKSSTSRGFGTSALRIDFRIEEVLKGGLRQASPEKPMWVTIEFRNEDRVFCQDREDDYILFLSDKGVEDPKGGYPPPLYPRIPLRDGVVIADADALRAVREAIKKQSK
jgi:hypothetical protein